MFSAATSGSWSWSLSVCLAVRYQSKLPTLEVMLDPSHIRHKNILDHFNLATLVYHIFSFAFNLLLFLDHKIVIKFLSLAVGIHNSQCQNYKCTYTNYRLNEDSNPARMTNSKLIFIGP